MSLLQMIALRAGVTTRHVERCLCQHPITGVTRRGSRGHWRAIGPVTRQRVDRFVLALGLKPGGKSKSLVTPAKLRLIDAAVNYLAAQQGQTSSKDSQWTTDEDWEVPMVQRLRQAPHLAALLSQGPEFTEAAICAMRIRNRGEKITRDSLATEQGISVATHRRRFSPAQYKSIRATALTPTAAPIAEGQGEAVEFLTQKLFEMLNTGSADDSPEALAEFCKMPWGEFCARYSRGKIQAAYREVDRLQIKAQGEPGGAEYREDVGLGFDAIEADNKRFAQDADRLRK